MRNWFGPEPQLGAIVAMVSLPIVAGLAYILVSGAIHDPKWFLLFFGLYAAGLALRFLLSRLATQTAVQVNSIAAVGFIGWVAWILIQAWLRDGLKGVLLSIGLMAFAYAVMWFAGKRAEEVDYSARK